MKSSLLAALAFLVFSFNSQAKECFDVSLKSERYSFCAEEVIDNGVEIELLDITHYGIGLKSNSKNAKTICSGTAYSKVKSFTARKDMYNRQSRIDSELLTAYSRLVKRLYSVTCY